MRVLPKSLCVALTLWFAVSCLMAADQPESPNSWIRWGAEEFNRLPERAKNLRISGDYSGAESLYAQAIEQAHRQGLATLQINYLIALGNIQVFQFKYADAISSYRQAADLAEQNHDWLAAGAIAPGLSSAYSSVGDLEAARQAIQRGRQDINRHLAQPNAAVPYYQAQLLLQEARIEQRLGSRRDLEPLFLAAIEQARLQPHPSTTAPPDSHDVPLEAEAWDQLGAYRLQHDRMAGAERAFIEAFRLRTLHAPDQTYLSYWRLAEYRLQEARNATDLDHRAQLLWQAAQFNDRYWRASSASGSALAEQVVMEQRGRIHELLGDPSAALEDFSQALELAKRWRAGVQPAFSAQIASDGEVARTIYNSYIRLAARQALRTGSARLARESFLANEEIRAVSLRQSIELAEVWRRKLPDAYWTKLGEFRAAATRLHTPEQELARLQLEISEMETAAASGDLRTAQANFGSTVSLDRLRYEMDEDELLLSFHMGEHQAYLWVLSGSALKLYDLGDREAVEHCARQFAEAIRTGQSNAAELGTALYQVLFGQLESFQTNKPHWLLSVEGELFSVPFAALVSSTNELDRAPRYLIEDHSLQVVPSALLLEKAPTTSQQGYLGLGDPIYNRADVRLDRNVEIATSSLDPVSTNATNRLISTGNEIRKSAQQWRQTGGNLAETTVLEGEFATRQRFLAALESRPSTIHLATHVFPSNVREDQSFLAFSLGPEGQPELLGTADIGLLSAPDALVVMTGCASGAGEIRQGAGMLGLTRAWLMAGARQVVATGWPVQDWNSDLIPNFYKYLGETNSAAEALQRSQVEMIHSGTWQADPAHWASYRITGGAK